jgi:hypothetical protein
MPILNNPFLHLLACQSENIKFYRIIFEFWMSGVEVSGTGDTALLWFDTSRSSRGVSLAILILGFDTCAFVVGSELWGFETEAPYFACSDWTVPQPSCKRYSNFLICVVNLE